MPCFSKSQPNAAEFEAWLDARTLHVDADVRVIDKPAGLAVQRGTATSGDLDGRLMARAAAGHERLRLVHRLDKETAGCLILAASQAAARLLGREFMARRVTKTYWALASEGPRTHDPRAAASTHRDTAHPPRFRLARPVFGRPVMFAYLRRRRLKRSETNKKISTRHPGLSRPMQTLSA